MEQRRFAFRVAIILVCCGFLIRIRCHCQLFEDRGSGGYPVNLAKSPLPEGVADTFDAVLESDSKVCTDERNY